jgi:hypothetical protein
LRGTRADDFADNNKAGGDTDPRLQRGTIRTRDLADFREDADASAHRAFRRILEGVREAEIGEHAVAHEFGDEAAVTPDRAGSGVLIAPDQRAEKFGIDGFR